MSHLKAFLTAFTAGFLITLAFVAFIKLDANVFAWDENSRFTLVLLGFLAAVVYAAVFGFEKEDKK